MESKHQVQVNNMVEEEPWNGNDFFFTIWSMWNSWPWEVSKLLPSSSLYHLLFFFYFTTHWPLTWPVRALPPQQLTTSLWGAKTPNFTSVSKETLDQSSRHPPVKVQFNNPPVVSQRTIAKWVDFWSSCQHLNIRPREDVLWVTANPQENQLDLDIVCA